MFWNIFNVVVFILLVANTINYFRKEHKSKILIEDILTDNENKQIIIKVLSSDKKDLNKVIFLKKHFKLKLDEAINILIKYKHCEI